jgi:hypothetical protein
MQAGDIAGIVRDGHWLAHRFIERQDAIRFLRLDRADHARATFITDEYLPADRPFAELPRAAALDAFAAPPAPIHFVFHSAFCCSTLVAAALDRVGVATALKEPVILNDIVGWRRRGAPPADVARALDGALTLLARPLAAGEAVVVKPSNVVASLSPVMLAMRPSAKALLLYAPIETFLTSIAKKGLDGRLWVRELFIGLRTDGIAQRLGFDDRQFFGQTDLQIAAAGWLAQQAVFADLVAKLGPNRVTTIDSEALLDRPAEAMAALASFFGLPLDAAAIADIVETSFARNAKSGAAFSRAERNAEYEQAASAYRDEIAKVAAWAKAVGHTAGIPLTLDARLIA